MVTMSEIKLFPDKNSDAKHKIITLSEEVFFNAIESVKKFNQALNEINTNLN